MVWNIFTISKDTHFLISPKFTVLNLEHVLQKVNGNQVMYLKTNTEWVRKQILHLKKNGRHLQCNVN